MKDAGTTGMCSMCGDLRTIHRIRKIVGAAPGEDVIAVVGRLVALRTASDQKEASEPKGTLESPPGTSWERDARLARTMPMP